MQSRRVSPENSADCPEPSRAEYRQGKDDCSNVLNAPRAELRQIRIADELAAVRTVWLQAGDEKALRRALLDLLRQLEDPEVARAVPLPARPQHLLDVAGAHGWFAAELCRRHPTLSATVLDLPGSARVGRKIIAREGMSDRVRHVDGDLLTARLEGPYEGILAFQIVHHLSDAQNVELVSASQMRSPLVGRWRSSNC